MRCTSTLLALLTLAATTLAGVEEGRASWEAIGRLLTSFSEAKQKEMGCVEVDLGARISGNEVKTMLVSLGFAKDCSVEEARGLYVKLLLGLIDHASRNRETSEYLGHLFPSLDQLCLQVSFLGSDGVFVPPSGEVALVDLESDGTLAFWTDSSDDWDDGWYTLLHQELLWDAIDQLQYDGNCPDYPWLELWLERERAQLPRSSFDSW